MTDLGDALLKELDRFNVGGLPATHDGGTLDSGRRQRLEDALESFLSERDGPTEGELETAESRVEDLEGEVRGLKDEHEGRDGEIDGLKKRVATLEEKLEEAREARHDVCLEVDGWRKVARQVRELVDGVEQTPPRPVPGPV